jgi:Catalase
MSVVPAKLPRAPQYTRADGTLLPRADTKVQISNKQGGGLPLLQDTQLIETLVHFSRERIPERVVHAKAAGVHGYFEATHDISDFLTGIGKRTELTTRISTVSPEKCSADTVRDVPSYATSKTSTHSCRFQTQRLRAPYPLITNTNFEALPRTVTSDHACIYYTRQMSLIYNTIIRSLNASHHHCSAFLSEDPKSPESMAFIEHDPDLGQIADFLEYNRLIFKIIDRHHRVEEEHMFQKIEDLLADVGGPRGSMEGNVAQHQAFEAGLSVFEAYVFKTQPREFQPHTLLHIIESFAPILIDHLHDKIATLLTLHVLKSEDLMKIWKKAEFEATKDDDMYTSLPFILGCQDPTFELDGEVRLFPRIPKAVRPALLMANKWWFSRWKAGVWRFLPSNVPREVTRCLSPSSSKFHEEF